MARTPSSLFYKAEGYYVGAVQFDILTGESHSIECQVTEHPVENGATVPDHVRLMPRKGSVSGLVTNSPLGNKAAKLPDDFLQKMYDAGKRNFVESLVAGQLAPLGSKVGKQGPTAADFAALPRPVNRAADTWELFKALMASGQPVVISTGLEKYKDVVVTKVSTDRDKNTGDALEFRVEFQEIQFVTLKEVAITTTTKPLNLSTDANKQASPKVSKGKTGGKAKGITDVKGTSKFAANNNKPLGVLG